MSSPKSVEASLEESLVVLNLQSSEMADRELLHALRRAG
jgi:hypothetical protein